MVAAAVIQLPGKVEVHQVPDRPPPYLRFMRPTRPNWASMKEAEELVSLDIVTVKLSLHRLFGFSVDLAYWPDSWQDEWAVDELREWEWPGWKNDPKRNKQYYADFIVDENQQANPNERRAIESQPISSRERNVVLVVHESIHQRDVDVRPDVPRGIESNSVLRLERGVSGGHETDLSGEDG